MKDRMIKSFKVFIFIKSLIRYTYISVVNVVRRDMSEFGLPISVVQLSPRIKNILCIYIYCVWDKKGPLGDHPKFFLVKKYKFIFCITN